MATDTASTWRIPTREQLGFRHPTWSEFHKMWKFTRDFYTADVLRPELLTTYLRQKKQGETNDAFRERCENADLTNHFGTIVDSLVGMLGQVETDAARVWGLKDKESGQVSGLGERTEPDTAAARLWRDADGLGTSWLAFWSLVATELSLTHLGWLMIDARDEDSDPAVRYLEPGCVVNWLVGPGGRLSDVLIREQVDARTSLWDKEAQVDQYLHITVDGWARYRLQDGALVLAEEPGTWAQHFEDDAGNRIVPLRHLVVPVKRQVGYYLAKKQSAIYNRESERDTLLRTANFPKLNVNGSETVYLAVVEALKQGNNVLQGTGHEFIAPPTESAALATSVLEGKSREFYMTGFREYGDAARERTATEVKQDVASGAAAYLTMLARALDQAETWAMHLLTQLEVPTQRAVWFSASVERSNAYAPADPEVVLDKLLRRTFGADVPVPVGRIAQENAAIMAAEYMGLGADKEQIKAAVAAASLQSAMATPGMAFPAQVRVQAMLKVLAALGMVDPDEVVRLEDGSQVKLLDIIKSEATDLAMSEDVAKRREAETFGVGGGLFGGPRKTPPEPDDDDQDAAA